MRTDPQAVGEIVDAQPQPSIATAAPAFEFVHTSIARRMFSYLELAHRQRGIVTITGPPGIGKNEIITSFKGKYPREVAVAGPPIPNARQSTHTRMLYDAIVSLSSGGYASPTSIRDTHSRLYKFLCDRDGVSVSEALSQRMDVNRFTRMTAIINEAPKLTREWVDTLSHWADGERGYSPFPIGFVLVGNVERILEPDSKGNTLVSRAVGDRLRGAVEFTYKDVLDDDLILYADSIADLSDDARAAIITEFSGDNAIRSFRVLRQALLDARIAVDGGLVTASALRPNFDAQRRRKQRYDDR